MSAPAQGTSNAKYYKEIRAKFERFRILIIGRRNSGKTTILQRVCNTTDKPLIFDRDGKKIQPDVHTLAPTTDRGIHEINNEMVFPHNPGFVFHDSRGFEGGQEDELGKVQEFINQRSQEIKLNNQLHAIWYCIPVDNPRPITRAEIQFFKECGTGKVPVVVIFTKMHVKDGEEWQEHGNDSLTAEQLRESAIKIIQQGPQAELMKLQYPPTAVVYLGEIQAQDIKCDILMKKTLDSLQDESLRLLLVSTQQVNLEICMKYAFDRYIKCIVLDDESWTNDQTKKIILCFPQHKLVGDLGIS